MQTHCCRDNEYLSVEPEVYAQHDIREKMAAIFIKRLTGNNMSYAWLCFRAGDEEKLQEAEKICLGQGDTEAYDLLQRIERKRIKMVNDSIEIDWSATDYPESAMQKLDEMAGHLDSAVAYCRKSSENPDYLVREYFEMASETSDMLDTVWNGVRQMYRFHRWKIFMKKSVNYLIW